MLRECSSYQNVEYKKTFIFERIFREIIARAAECILIHEQRSAMISRKIRQIWAFNVRSNHYAS